ncbi:MAG: hypothetical protein IT162_23720 [Bryobacterales bacterium]|nr:hypothetical protein [Bryobacterales bacterium]
MQLATLTRVVVLLVPCLLMPRTVAVAEAEAPKDLTEFREAAHRMLGVVLAMSGDKAGDSKIFDLRTRLVSPLPGGERPMSEQSRPLLTLPDGRLVSYQVTLAGAAGAEPLLGVIPVRVIPVL